MNQILIKIPKFTNRSESGMEEYLADIHRQLVDLSGSAQDRIISLELLVLHKYIYFYISVNSQATNIVISQLYAHFSGVEVEKSPDYLDLQFNHSALVGCNIKLAKKDLFPLKTYATLSNDSFTGLTGIFSKMAENETAFMQIVIKPVKDTWEEQGKRYLKNLIHFTTESQDARDAMYMKYNKLYYATCIRLGCCSTEPASAVLRLQSFFQALTQYDNDVINNLVMEKIYRGERAFIFLKNRFQTHNFYLNIEELASIYHFPSVTVAPNVVRVLSRKAAPPVNLPSAQIAESPDISTFALTNFRNDNIPFGIKHLDRRRHLYVVGKTGMGKSKLLELLMYSDIHAGRGFAILDPHGDLAEQILKYIPNNRINDVIYYNPADEVHPIGFNPLEVTDRAFYQQVVTGFTAIFKKLFISGWNPRLEHILRFITLALLETRGASVVDIPRLLINKTYRQDVISQIQDPVVKDFWTHEFASWNEKYDNEAIIPILNKVSELTSSPLMRNTLGQKKSGFSVNDVMDQRKILIANLSSGKLGEENSAFLGSMLVTQIQQAAMSRANLPEDKRNDFLLYVDEFQNFATTAFATILSEARKYRLSLTIAHQYIDQLGPEIQKTVFGNIGSLITFRVGAGDARFLESEYAPAFKVEDLMNLDVRQIAVKMAIDGITTEPFSAQTIDLPVILTDYSGNIIDHSRKTYAVKQIIPEGISGVVDVSKEQPVVFENRQNFSFETPIL